LWQVKTPQANFFLRPQPENNQTRGTAMKPEHREILVMKYVQEHRYDEIACILGVPRGTVMSRLYHARMALREEYLKPDQDCDRPSPQKVI